MADKNKINQHFRNSSRRSPTTASKLIEEGANKLGSWFLQGLGALGRVLNAGFTSPTYGTNGQVSYARNIQDANRLRKLSESLEQALSKGATYIMPANYIVGKGNPVKGEETISLMLPWQLAVIRGSELYFGPKTVKGVKNIPKAVVNTAAKAGVNPAKTAVIAREINNATKKGVQSLEKIQPEIRTRYGDVEIDNPELAYRLVGKGAVENFLKTGELFVPVKLTGNKLMDALNNMMGGTPMYKQGSLWYGLDPINYPELFTTAEPLAIGNKHATIVKPWINPGRVIKKGIRTGEVDYVGKANLLGGRRVPFTEDLLNLSNVTAYKWVPGYGYRKVIQEPRTSLKFFERKPSKIAETEKFGLNKHDRKLLSENEQLALLDLALYKSSGQYRQVFRVTPDWENFGWNLDRSNPTFMLLFAKEGKSMRGPWARVMIQSPTGKGALAVNPEKNMAGYTSRSFPVPEGMDWAPGEANMMIEGTNGLKLILTAPKTDFFDAIVEKGSESIGEKLSNIIDKNVMKDFWINSRKAQRPGTYLSGDNATLPKGSDLIEAFRKRLLYKASVKERPLAELFTTRTGLSPDSYSSIIRLGMRDGSLRWGEGFEKWNNSAILNKYIFDSWLKMLKGEISIPEYERIFNSWSLSIGGKPLLIFEKNGNVHIIHPHPYIFSLKQGGKMNILEFLKNGSGIHIKKKNRGKFTSYCGGKVTDECILKGKNSSNPAIRKRATFAANARKWKHKEGGSFKGYPSKAAYDVRLEEVAGFKKGGIFKAADGAKTNTWSNVLNSGWGLFAINGIGSLLLSRQYNKALSDESDIAKAELDKEESLLRDLANYSSEAEANLIMSLTYDPNNPNSNGGDIARSYIKNKLLSHKLFDITLKLNLLRDLIDLQTKQMKDLNNLNTWTSILLTGLGTLGTYLNNKNDNNQKQSTSV